MTAIIKFTDTQFDRDNYLQSLQCREVQDFFGFTEGEQSDLIASAEQSFNRRKSKFLANWMALLTDVPRNAQGYWDDLNCLNDNATCNAARQLYRILGSNVRLDGLLRARYNIAFDQDAATRLALDFDWDAKRFVPSLGTDWSDLNFAAGPH